jgi:hypothetical protein
MRTEIHHPSTILRLGIGNLPRLIARCTRDTRPIGSGEPMTEHWERDSALRGSHDWTLIMAICILVDDMLHVLPMEENILTEKRR